jgi:hypothetical protein
MSYKPKMDPLQNIPSEIFQNVFSAFNADELKDLMCVSKHWYQTIAYSTKIMRKVRLSVRGDWMEESEIKALSSASDRSYSSILISSVMSHDALDLISNPYYTLKEVNLYDISFDSYSMLESFFENFQTTLTSLTMSGIHIKKVNDDENDFLSNLNFLSLKELAIFCSHTPKLTRLFLRASQNLTKLELRMTEGYFDENVVIEVGNIATLKTFKTNDFCMQKILTLNLFSNVAFQLDKL